MIKWRLGAALVGLILLSPIIVLNVWGVRMSLWMNDDIEFAEKRREGTVTADQAPVMPTSPMAWFRNRAELKNSFSPDELNKARTVTVSADVTIDDLLADGEAAPEQVYEPLYIEARAPVFLMQFCRDVLATIGSECVVNNTKTKQTTDGTFSMSGDLRYLPSYDLGQPEKQDGAKLLSVVADLAGQRAKDLPVNGAIARKDYLNNSASICAALTAEYGNCVVSDVNLVTVELDDYALRSLPEGTEPERLDAWVRFSVYAPDTPDTVDALSARVKELVQNQGADP